MRLGLVTLPIAAAAAIALLVASVTSTHGQFTASITNPHNSVRSGSVGLSEDEVCAAPGDGQWHDCAALDKFGGGSLAPGTSTTTTVTLRNTGASPARLFLLPSQCSDTLTGAHGGLCDQVTVQVTCDGDTVVAPRTLNVFHDERAFPTGYPVGTLDAGVDAACDLTLVAGPISEPGAVSQPISWRLTTAQEVPAAMTP